MLRRTLKAVFASGMYVFPGGAVDDADRSPDVEAWCDGLTDRQASGVLEVADRRPGVLDRRHPGVLRGGRRAAGPPAGRAFVRFDEPERRVSATWPTARPSTTGRCGWSTSAPTRACAWPPTTSTTSATGSPRSASRRRFDTRFFVARAPQAQEPLHDDHETIASLWVRPADALARQRAGRAGDDRADDEEPRAPGPPRHGRRGAGGHRLAGRPPAIRPKLRVDDDGRVEVVMPADPEFADLPELDQPRR